MSVNTHDHENALLHVARTLAEKSSLTLHFQANSPLPNPLSDKEALHVPPLQACDDEDISELRGSLDLWAAAKQWHNKTTHKKSAINHPALGDALTLLELSRLEWLISEDLAGAGHNISDYQASLMPQLNLEDGELPTDLNNAQLGLLLTALLKEKCTDRLAHESFIPYLLHYRAILSDTLTRYGSQLYATRRNQDAYAALAQEMLLSAGIALEEHKASLSSQAERGTQTSEIEADQDAASDDADGDSTDSDSASDESDGSSDDSQPSPLSGSGLYGGDMADISSLLPGLEGDGHSIEVHGDWENGEAAAPPPDYHSFSTGFDEEIHAHALATTEELQRLRGTLDTKLEDIRDSLAKISAKLQRVLMAQQQRSWQFDTEEGLINSARLARLVASPNHHAIFKQEKEADFKDTVVTLLFDNSGSMRGRPITIAALTADILAKTLERASVKTEVLGFTTVDWKGGESFKAWDKEGRTSHPGRLNDLRHIIYKAADTPYIRARHHFGLMLKDGLLKENIDGEALLWAKGRLKARSESRKILMIISDGAPVDDCTLTYNASNYLDQHLRDTIKDLEHDKTIELIAIGIGHDVSRYYKNSVTIRDVTHLGETISGELVGLLGKH